MKKCAIAFLFAATLFSLAGCKDKEAQKDNPEAIYSALTEANENYGLKPENTCKSIFKCDVSDIREKVVIAPTWEPEIFKAHVDKIEKVSGPTGHGYTVYNLKKGDKIITYVNVGIGAGNLMDAVLTLGQTNCKEVIFIGSNGALKDGIKIGDIMIPEYSVCGVGADRYLCTNDVKNNDCFGKKYYPDTELLDNAMDVAKSVVDDTDIRVYTAQNYSCDSIYAQYAHLEEVVNLGCNSIEMETATLFNSAKVAGLKSVAIFNVSDNSASGKSLYNGRTHSDQERRATVKNNIMPKIVLKLAGLL